MLSSYYNIEKWLMSYFYVKESDSHVYEILQAENSRQENGLEMIASENFVSQAVLDAYTSTFTNKYAEGYPNKRYYGGCVHADTLENLAIQRLKQLFHANYANVQPHSGAQANMAIFLSFLSPQDTILGMDLSHGGHLTHGSSVNFSGIQYKTTFYGVSKKDYQIDMDHVEQQVKDHKPKMIIVGASAYPRIIPFDKFYEIGKKYQTYIMVDMAHISGLVAAKLHPSPIDYADFVTSTTHKTLRGPRGGFILSNNIEYEKPINKAVFPGVQGGPLMHAIAAKAVAFGEALQPDFNIYQQRVLDNAKALANELIENQIDVLTGGTENHIVLIDTFTKNGITGRDAEKILESVGITANKNAIPYDSNPPYISSGIRLGSPALTTRGLGKDDFIMIAKCIAKVVHSKGDESILQSIRLQLQELCSQYPMTKFRL